MYHKFETLCEKKGITVYQACKEIGIKQSTISNVKNDVTGKRKFSFETLEKICSYFGVSLDYFRE